MRKGTHACMHTCSRTLVDVHSEDTEESRHLSSFVHVNMETDIARCCQSSCPHFVLSPSPTVLSADSRLRLGSFSRLCSPRPPVYFTISACSPQSPMASSEPILVLGGQSGHKCTEVCTSVCLCVHPFCRSCSFPTECVPALCVCWLTGEKERQLFSTYPETLPCQVWDEILSIIRTPHSQASHSKPHTTSALGGRLIPC